MQELLSKVNGMDLDVVFAPRKEPLIPPRYQLMNRDQLKEVSSIQVYVCCYAVCVLCIVQAHTKTVSEAKQLLQMTPVLPERKPRGQTLRHDQELDGFLDHRMIFTDISTNKENKVGFSNLFSSSPSQHLLCASSL